MHDVHVVAKPVQLPQGELQLVHTLDERNVAGGHVATQVVLSRYGSDPVLTQALHWLTLGPVQATQLALHAWHVVPLTYVPTGQLLVHVLS